MDVITYRMTIKHDDGNTWSCIVGTPSVQEMCRTIMGEGFLLNKDGVETFIPPRYIKLITFTPS